MMPMPSTVAFALVSVARTLALTPGRESSTVAYHEKKRWSPRYRWWAGYLANWLPRMAGAPIMRTSQTWQRKQRHLPLIAA